MSKLTAEQKDLLYRIETNPELQPFFFRKAKGLEWFDPLDEKGFFSPDKNPRPIPAKEEGYVNIPTWPVTEYLVAASHELNDPGNERYAKKFLEIIRNCTKYAIAEKFGNYRTWWQFVKIIKNIPSQLITLDDVELIGFWLEDPYERSLVAEELGEEWLILLLNADDAHCNELAASLLDQLYLVKFVDRKYGSHEKKEPELRFDNFQANKITRLVAPEVGRKLGLPGVKIFRQLLLNLLKELGNDKWSSIWRSAIEDQEQNHGRDDADDILIQAFRDSLLGFVETKPEEAVRFVSSLFDGEYETIKRVAIYVIDRKCTL